MNPVADKMIADLTKEVEMLKLRYDEELKSLLRRTQEAVENATVRGLRSSHAGSNIANQATEVSRIAGQLEAMQNALKHMTTLAEFDANTPESWKK